jgi:hypothetical protein
MSLEQIDQNQIIDEINLIPEDKRKELYELIHNFRISLERCAPRWRSQSHHKYK